MSIVLAAVGRVGASEAAEAVVRGMAKIAMASMLIGVASAVAIVLEQGRILAEDRPATCSMRVIACASIYRAATIRSST
jgi:hypothetical protein